MLLPTFWVFFYGGIIIMPLINCFNFGFSTKSIIKMPKDLQIDPDGLFDIRETPEQFREIDQQIVS